MTVLVGLCCDRHGKGCLVAALCFSVVPATTLYYCLRLLAFDTPRNTCSNTRILYFSLDGIHTHAKCYYSIYYAYSYLVHVMLNAIRIVYLMEYSCYSVLQLNGRNVCLTNPFRTAPSTPVWAPYALILRGLYVRMWFCTVQG